MQFSVIIPVYNRPDEVDELLQSLTTQTVQDFEVLIIEDGSEKTCKDVIDRYSSQLDISYHFKPNSGQGFSRNYGFERAKGDYFVVFDSDCITPDHYFETIQRFLKINPLDAWGGPDRSHPSFTALQKAISYCMTSPFTTGGIRGGKKHIGTFHPRSFNMGISREVFEKTGGYSITRMGEDIEFSIRIIRNGFKTGLIPDAYVYHKRRTSFRHFYRQLHFFGRARINIKRIYKDELKTVHTLPSFFTIGIFIYPFLPLISDYLFSLASIALLLFILLIFIDSLRIEKNILVALLSVPAAFIQLTAYGIGFLTEMASSLRK